MMQYKRSLFILGLSMALLVPCSVQAADFAGVTMAPGQIAFTPLVSNMRLVVTVAGPNEYFDRQELKDGVISLSMTSLEDGSYNYELRAEPILSEETQKILAQARQSGDYSAIAELRRQGKLPEQALVKSGSFLINNGALVLPVAEYNKPASDRDDGAVKDIVHLDDVIIDGSLCVGMDCVNNESFGFDTIRLKENNTRIKFDDTSNSGSFPANDWQLTANESDNGGLNKFSIEDISNGRIPVTFEAGAPSNSLYVDDGGNVGLGTSTPVVQLHVKDGNTPTLRLEQDGSSGFTAQTWDVAGNEANFFIRDATNGSKLPFRIKPNAPSNTIFIKENGNIGVGTDNPTRKIDVRDAAEVYFEDDGPVKLLLKNTATNGAEWAFNSSADGTFRISDTDATPLVEMEVNGDGNMKLAGTLTVCFGSSTCTQTTYPDYVFEEDYPLMPISDLASFVKENKHLPNIPSAATLTQTGLNMTEMQIKLLEKVEELTLYTLAQQERIQALEEQLATK